MTEIERILQKGIIDKDFLKEEVRNDFLISVERKKLWAVLLDLLVEFDKVCRKHNLRYYVFYGALLGAVRHQGFIPWDDDFDVTMPREDYERFIKLNDEFKEPYFLQTPYSDPESFYSYAKLRNSFTTGVSEMFKYQNFNHGIWMTVFPLDYWDVNGGEERYSQIRKLATDCSTYMRSKNPELDEKNKARVAAYHGNPLHDYEEIQRLASSCRDHNCKHMMTATITLGSYKKNLFEASDFAKTIELEFEGLKVTAPMGYEGLLRILYNDYMQFPPLEERGKWHGDIIFDTETPYKDYLKRQGIVFE